MIAAARRTASEYDMDGLKPNLLCNALSILLYASMNRRELFIDATALPIFYLMRIAPSIFISTDTTK